MTESMPRPRPKHLHRETTRHGETVWYFRRGAGPRTRLRESYGTKAFWVEFEAALAGRPAEAPKAVSVGTMAWLISRYMTSAQWTESLSTATRAQRSGILQETARIAGTEPIEVITTRAIREGMDRRAARPHGANNWLKTMRGLFGYAVERDYLHVIIYVNLTYHAIL